MATAIASHHVSENHSASTENTPSAVHRLQMAIADTECAQALLELAMSIVPIPSSPPTIGGVPCTESAGDSKASPSPQGLRSLLKRKLESPVEEDDLLLVPPQQSGADAEQLRQELVKRIRLDHNYHSTGDDRKAGDVVLEPDQFRTYCETIKQHGSVPTSSENSEDGDLDVSAGCAVTTTSAAGTKVSDKENSLDHPPDAKTESCGLFGEAFAGSVSKAPRQRTVSETKTMPVRASRPRSCSESRTSSGGSSWKKKTSLLKGKSGRRLDEGQAAAAVVSEVTVYDHKPSPCGPSAAGPESNLQLLLKCLVANEPDEVQAVETFAGGQQTTTTTSLSSDDADDGKPRSNTEGGGSNSRSGGSPSAGHNYQCQVCHKTFLKKRYLTKHAFRMHPCLGGSGGGGASDDDFAVSFTGSSGSGKKLAPSSSSPTSVDSASCVHCKQTVKPRKELPRHLVACAEGARRPKKPCELDLVGCQLCGVKMRRQLLVRHLAEEHCVDRLIELSERPAPTGSEDATARGQDNTAGNGGGGGSGGGGGGGGGSGVECSSDADNVLTPDRQGEPDAHAPDTKSPPQTPSWQHVTEFGATHRINESQGSCNA